MTDFNSLTILLHDKAIATLTNLPGDKNLFTFNEEYINDKKRSTLSLSFRDIFGDLITDIKSTRSRLPPFLANLLPEGHMRDYLASQAGVNPDREFYLLATLGQDLPGALQVLPSKEKNAIDAPEENHSQSKENEQENTKLHFSLAGVQLKFSAVLEKEGGLTIPVNGVGGSWIVKLPSTVYAGVPENEYVMMQLAKNIGIDVPENALIPINQI